MHIGEQSIGVLVMAKETRKEASLAEAKVSVAVYNGFVFCLIN